MSHRLIVSMLLLSLTAPVAAQETTAGAGRGEGSRFGAPVLKYTRLQGQGAMMLGGRGGWNVTPALVVGAGAYGTVSEVDAPEGAVANAPTALDIRLETFGFDVEYAPRMDAPLHLTWTAFLGGGAAHHVRDGTTEQHGETDFLLVFEPALGIERSLARWLHVNLAASYRVVHGVEMAGSETADLAGPTLALAAKLGRF